VKNKSHNDRLIAGASDALRVFAEEVASLPLEQAAAL